MRRRGSGIILHPTSLPSRFGVGDLGPQAYWFADFLERSGQSYWQMLPLSPTEPGRGNSPYNSSSAFAGNPLLISPEWLVREGHLYEEDLAVVPDFPAAKVDYPAAQQYKWSLLRRAYENWRSHGSDPEFSRFQKEQAYWLPDFCLFQALAERHHFQMWNQWPTELRDRYPGALQQAGAELAGRVEEEAYLQYVFQRQIRELREYCNQRGISLFGDMPIYVDYHSADVWAHQDLFKLNQDKRPSVVSGVPPDYFSATGQYWGNPVFNWEAMRVRRYQWWIKRLERNFAMYDLLRIDHFRGLVAYWEIPAQETTAMNGSWQEAPVMDFFRALQRRFQSMPIVAEDLGYITPDVRETLALLGLPGMKLFIFAFGEEGADNPYQPHNYPRNCVAYTGTHDNNTMRGWFEAEADEETRQRLSRYLGRELSADNVAWESLRAIMASVADTALAPLQDLLGLGAEARMNRPSQSDGNWGWRLQAEMLSEELAARLRQLAQTYGRV
jgi:4-alpha-glucanotransferase